MEPGDPDGPGRRRRGRTADPHLGTVSDHSSMQRLFDVGRCNPASLRGRLRLLAPWLMIMLAECAAHGAARRGT